MLDGSTVNVLFELDTEGVDDICTHVLKLPEDTCKDPEHIVLEVLVVTVVVSIASLKVTAIVELNETEVSESAGEDEETVGDVIPVVVVVSSSVEVVEEPPLLLLLPQEMTVRLKRNIVKMMSICFTWFPIGGLGWLNIYYSSYTTLRGKLQLKCILKGFYL